MEASATQQSDDWTRSNGRGLRYFGGSTQVIVPDNLRSAVSRSDPYEPGINAQFDACAAHYGVVIMPARVRRRRPRDGESVGRRSGPRQRSGDPTASASLARKSAMASHGSRFAGILTVRFIPGDRVTPVRLG